MPYRSLLSLNDLPLDEITAVLDRGAAYLPRIKAGGFKDDRLRGVSVLLLFYEASTRTRVSFELAGKLLGADTINVSAQGSSVEKGESIADTAQTLSAMGLGITIMRHSAADSVALYAANFAGGVLNAGSGRAEHPSQALLDALTLKQAGKLEAGRHMAIVGDIEHSRVMRSSAALLARYGLRVTLVAPPSLMPPAWTGAGGASVAACEVSGREAMLPAAAGATDRSPDRTAAGSDLSVAPTAEYGGLQIRAPYAYTPDFDSVLPTLDAVMMLRMQKERMGGGEVTTLDEFARLYGLSPRRLALLPRDAVIMHPGPVNRGVEVAQAVYADPRCLINDQVTSGVAVRCALLAWSAGKLA